MRVLMTGCTPLQVNSKHAGKATQKINVPRALRDLLMELGHEVDWRVAQVGESLTKYDLLVVNIGPIQSLNARIGALGSMWCLSQHLPTLIHFDDWQVYQVLQQFKSFLNLGDKQIFKELGTDMFEGKTNDVGPFFKLNYHDPELVDRRRELMDVAREFREPWTRWLAVCPMYPWGDKSIALERLQFVDKRHFSFLDPTSMVISKYVPTGFHTNSDSDKYKERAWAMASVMAHDDWVAKQNLSWPVKLFGTTKKSVREGKATTLRTEDDVRNEYARRWGVLSPEYPQSGSGWWRSRFVYAAQVGSVLYAGMKDGQQLGPAYQHSVRDIERLDDEALRTVAHTQAETLRSKVWTKAQLLSGLKDIIERAELLA